MRGHPTCSHCLKDPSLRLTAEVHPLRKASGHFPFLSPPLPPPSFLSHLLHYTVTGPWASHLNPPLTGAPQGLLPPRPGSLAVFFSLFCY